VLLCQGLCQSICSDTLYYSARQSYRRVKHRPYQCDASVVSLNSIDKDELAIVRLPDANIGVRARHPLADVAALDKMYLRSNNVTDIISADAVAGEVFPTNF